MLPITKADKIGHYTLSHLPGNPQVGVSHDVYIYPESRGKGLGQAQHRDRLIQSWHAGFKYLLCTVRADNKTELHILAKNGWKKLDEFHSCDNDHTLIFIYGRHTGYQDHYQIDSSKP